MQDKIPILIAYGLLGLLLALAPLFVKRGYFLANKRPTLLLLNEYQQSLLMLLVIVLTLLLMHYLKILAPAPFLLLLILLVIGLLSGAVLLHSEYKFSALNFVAATLLACTASVTLLWWRRQFGMAKISNAELIYFATILVSVTAVLLAHKPAPAGRTRQIITFGLFCTIAAYFSFTLASLTNPATLYGLWHHWGAYIGPSEMVLAGARLFYDIPAQYGAGPTLLLAATCRADCWSAAYWVFGLAAFSFSVLVGILVWFMRKQTRYSDLVLLLLCIVTCTFWNSYPLEVSGPIMTPSSNGIAFSPRSC